MSQISEERLSNSTKQLIEYTSVTPQWKNTVELATHSCKDKEALISAAQHRAAESNTKRRKVEFACHVLNTRLKSLTKDTKDSEESTERSRTTLECAKEQWNKISENLAICNANTTECSSISQQKENEINCLEQENITLRKGLTIINERKRVQETITIENRKRFKDLEDKEKSLETRNNDLRRKLEQLYNSHAEGSSFHNMQLIHQSLSDEITVLSTVNEEIGLQKNLERAIKDEVELLSQEETNKLQMLRNQSKQADEDIQWLANQIQEKNAVLDEVEIDENEWTPEIRELWQECVSLKNKNTHIAKDIKQMANR